MHFADVFQRGKSNMMANAVKGAAAGAIAVWAMDKLNWFFFRISASLRSQFDRPQ